MKTTKFKPSEVGPIPVDWEVKRLRDVCDKIRNGYGYDFREHGTYPMSRIETISSGEINYSRVALIEDEPPPEYRLRPGDILYSHINSLPYIGNIAQYDGSGCLYHGMNLLLVRPTNTVDSVYLKYILKSEPMRNLARSAAKVAINQASISTKELAQFQIVLPPRPEQEKIAEALSDVDALLAAMTKLIEKKRAIKQGAMQQLLTGKKRLAGFIGPWVEKRICDIGQVVTGATPPRNSDSNWTGNFPWISAKDFKGKYIWDSEEHISDSGRMFCRILPANSVLVTCIASIGLNAISKVSCATNQQINAVVCKTWDTEFFYYQICRMCEDLKQIAGQTAVPIIGKSQFEQMSISGPSDFAEQKAIAEVLSDMDAEIAALEAKRAKYESIKQGMMQELLTGKTRLA